jgi:four helix bundle protein
MKNNLDVWKLAHELALMVYRLTDHFPKSEQFGLVSQLRRGAGSIPANIVEGQSRQHRKEFLQFLYISKGSAEEIHYHLFLSKELGFIPTADYSEAEQKCIRIKMMLNKLINSLAVNDKRTTINEQR